MIEWTECQIPDSVQKAYLRKEILDELSRRILAQGVPVGGCPKALMPSHAFQYPQSIRIAEDVRTMFEARLDKYREMLMGESEASGDVQGD